MAEQILKNIYRMTIPLPGSPLKELNTYLIKDEKRSLLIDTGYRNEGCRQALFSQLAELGLRPGDVDVLLTHLHTDHTGLCRDVGGDNGKIYISRADRFILGSEEDWDAHWEKSDARLLAEGFPAELLVCLPLRDREPSGTPQADVEHICLDDGDVLEAGGYRLRCVLTPGHTPGHMCFWIEEEGIMFLGDHVLFDISPNISVWDGFEDALGKYLKSLEEIQKFDIRYALPAHRGSGDTKQRASELLRHHEQRLEEAFAIARANPGSTAYELAGKLTWRIRARSWDDFPISQKWFAVGETVAHLEHLEARGQLRREAEGGIVRCYPL